MKQLARVIKGLLAMVLIFCIVSFNSDSGIADPSVFDVTKYGAVGNGLSDDSKAFSKAWADFCGSPGANNILYIPKGKTFLLQSLKFQGPCKSSSIHVQVLGTIVAPNTVNWESCEDNSWLVFSNVNGLLIDGSGVINGQGSLWWNQPNIGTGNCKQPTALLFNNCNNLQLSGLTHLNSPRNHISINNCNNIAISNLHIIAPEESPNTDGIDIANSRNVNVHDCVIGTGDDCIAINTGSANINITHVACGRGHGISIGSLGVNGAYATVEQVYVRNCNFTRTQNGARIKTWPGASGYARQITFEQITLVAAQNPIIIDQNYCNGSHNCRYEENYFSNKALDVKVSDVTYIGFQGSSASEEAISLDCSPDVACTNIKMKGISITSATPGKQVRAFCNNAHGTSSSTTPAVPCLSKSPLLI